ncbi:Hypothetical protein HDN1F_26880 [gamma proteobacterium HdN1]|nr:Hypothetical protein HDN1F_26880 [gamma proteobacterium HdN1]
MTFFRKVRSSSCKTQASSSKARFYVVTSRRATTNSTVKGILLGCIVLLLAACGSFKSTTQTEEGTFLQLVGSVENATLQLDDATLDLNNTRDFNLNGKRVTKIAIQPGQHRVTITRDGSTLVDRRIFVTEGNAFEINLP